MCPPEDRREERLAAACCRLEKLLLLPAVGSSALPSLLWCGRCCCGWVLSMWLLMTELKLWTELPACVHSNMNK